LYADVEVRLEVAIAGWAQGRLQPTPIDLLNPHGTQTTLLIDTLTQQ
jgi:hypothetical protein